jgi:hypothetical protein
LSLDVDIHEAPDPRLVMVGEPVTVHANLEPFVH